MLLNFLFTRQIIAEVLLVFDLFFAGILIRYLVVKCRELGPAFWRDPVIHGAFALLVLMVGHTIIRFWGVVIFYQLSQGANIFDMENRMPLALMGTAVAVVGMCWIIRVFSPSNWGEKSWVAACLLAGLFVGFMRLVT
jgi:hypothetical protein